MKKKEVLLIHTHEFPITSEMLRHSEPCRQWIVTTLNLIGRENVAHSCFI